MKKNLLKDAISRNYFKQFSYDAIRRLFRDKIYVIILASIFIKSILFTSLLGSKSANEVSISEGFFSVPPYLIYLSFSLLILSVAFLIKGRIRLFFLIAIDFFISLLFISDLLYFRATTGFISFNLIFNKWNFNTIKDIFNGYSKAIDSIFLIDIISLFIYVITNKTIYKNKERNIKAFIITLLIPILYLSYAHIKIDKYKRCFFGQTVFVQSWAPTQTMSNLGPIGYLFFDGYEYYKYSRPYVLSENDKLDIQAWFEENKEHLEDNEYNGIFKGKNLLIIQFESLENFVIDKNIQGQEITPTLNKLLKNSLYFSNYHENVYNGTSSDADLMTNTGVYPVRIGSTFFRFPNNKYENSLPNTLKGIGYSTIAIHPDKGSYWNWMPSLKSIGFDKCLDSNFFDSKDTIGLGISDGAYLNEIIPVLDNLKQPFYSFLVTQSSHGPFDLPDKYRKLKLDSNMENNILGDYFQSLHYSDEKIGEFLDNLSNKNLLNNTVVVIYGDHTGVHKFYQDQLDSIRNQEDWCKDNQMEIPLIIYNPSIKNKTFDIQCGQIDLMPTIEYMMGISEEKYQNSTFGKVLVNTNKKYTILEDNTMIGQYSLKQKLHSQKGIILSDKMVQNNYFKSN